MVNQLDRNIINNHIHTMRGKYDIIIIALLIDAEIILKARTAAPVDSDAQHQGLAFGRAEPGQTIGGAGGQDDPFRRARGDAEGGCGRFCGLDGAHSCLYEARAGVRKGPVRSKPLQS